MPRDTDGSGGAEAASLTVHGLRKGFAVRGRPPLPVLEGIDLDVAAGSFAAIVGPSGSGKSTLFNVLSGLETADAGEVRVGGTAHDGRPGRSAYMPQRDALMPWRRIRDNVSVGLEIDGVPRREARHRALRLLTQFELDPFADAYPDQLSGGMRSRVALLRTIATQRPIVFLDEPLGALDSFTREQVQEWLLRLLAAERRTALLVTHDIEEAIFMSNEVFVLSPRPATVTARLEIDIPWPRDRAVVDSPHFVELKARLRRLLADAESAASAARVREGTR